MAKYATVELTKVASRKTGEIEAQCKLNADINYLENGEIVYVDAVNDEITKTFNANNCVDAIYLHFSNPRRYEDGHTGMEISDTKETTTMELLEINIFQEFTN